MFALLRLVVSLFVCAVVIWFATMVPLGSRTLWGHLRAISGTQEAKELAEGTKAEAMKVAGRLLGRDAGVDAAAPGRALEDVGARDRAGLDRLTRPHKK